MAKIIGTKEEDIVNSPEFEEIVDTLAECDSPETIKAFFCDSLSRIELDRLRKRWIAVKSISEGLSYRQISREHGISTSTVHLAIESIHNKRGGWEYLLNKFVQDRKL